MLPPPPLIEASGDTGALSRLLAVLDTTTPDFAIVSP
jgi:hypothetical protein